MDAHDPDPIERFIEGVFGFVWRWFWRIAIWGAVAILALIALFYFLDWAFSDRAAWSKIGWGVAFGWLAWMLHEVQQSLGRVFDQNVIILRRLDELKSARRTGLPDFDD